VITVEEAIRLQIDFLRYARKYVALGDPARERLTRDIQILRGRLKNGVRRPVGRG